MSFVHRLDELIDDGGTSLTAKAQHWERVPLRSIATVINGFPFPSSGFNNTTGTAVIRIRDIVAGRTSTFYQGPTDDAPLIEHGDLVVGMDGDFNSRLWPGEPALMNQRVCKVVPDESVYSKRFLAYVLPGYLKLINDHTSAITVKHLSSNTVQDIPLPLPPRREQERIASKLDELFSEIEEGERALERVQKLVERYRQSVLKAAVTGELTQEWREKHKGKLESGEELLRRILKARREAWERAKLAERKAKGVRLADDKWKKSYQEPTKPKIALSVELPASWAQLSVEGATCGERPVAYGVLQPGEDLPSGVPLVRVCDIADGAVDTQNLKRILPQVADQFPRTKLRGREVLLTIVGTIGRTAIAPKALAGANVARAVAVMSPTENVTSEWLEICLRHEKARQVLTGAAREVARKTLNLEQLREYAIPVPSLAEQNEVVSRVSALLSRVRAGEEDIESQLLTARALRQAVLKAAFCGALVPQDPNDEPASRILARIVGEHSSARGIARGSRSRKAEHAK